MKSISWFVRITAVSALALIVAVASLGFGGGASAAPAQADSPLALCYNAASIALVRIVHASPNSPAVDIYMDKEAKPSIAKLAYGKAALDGKYVEVAAGTHHIAIFATGDTKTALFDQDVTVAGMNAYTLVAYGTTNDKNFTVKAYTDNASDTAGMARVEVIHAVSDGPAVDVITTGKSGATLISKLAAGDETSIDVKPGTYDLAVIANGDAKQTALISLPKTKLDADTITTVIATGLVGTAKGDKKVALKAEALASASQAGFGNPAATPEPTAAATAAAAAPTAAATAVATAVATKAAPTVVPPTPAPTVAPTNIPVGQTANAGFVPRSSTKGWKYLNGGKCIEIATINIAGGPADLAGLKAGDLILGIDGKAVTTPASVFAAIAAHKSGDKVTFNVQKKGELKETDVPVTLGANPFAGS